MTRPRVRARTAWPGASRDRWLIGYADIVTLLFACFASLYANERAAPPRREPAPDLILPLESPLPTRVPPVWATALAAEFVGDPDLAVETDPGGVVISLFEAGAFAPGQAQLSEAAARNLARLAAALAPLSQAVRVEGHTDDRPIQTSAFVSNWELSTARAIRVVQALVQEHGIAPERLSAAGHAAYRPRVPNTSEANRARNRRVDLVVLNGGRP